MTNFDTTTENSKMYCGRHRHGGLGSRIFLGILLIGSGSILIARQFGWLTSDLSHIILSWPMLLIAFGVFNLARRTYSAGFILTAIGSFFIIPRIMEVPEDFTQNFWPIVMIVIGIFIMLHRHHPHHHRWEKGNNTNASMDESAIFGGRDISIVNDNFTGGKITSIFGGSKINLLYSKPAPGCVIEIETVFGGTKLIVPEDWNIKVEVSSIFGGFEDRRSPSVISRSDPNKTVVIKGSCIFGGGEITSMP
jgi:predicted membrane protein